MTSQHDILDIRHRLHAHPGLSGSEAYAHDLIVSVLQSLSPVALHSHVGGYGVIAVWGTDRTAPTLALRADTDALPIDEPNDLPYRSTVANVAHKCGHDGHTAIMLRVAELLAASPDLYADQNVMLLFQPEEETGYGSQKLIDSGIMQQYNIKAVYGLHNIPGYREGELLLNPATFAAASVGVKYKLTGRQTHASTPEKGVNPGLAVAEIIETFAHFNAKGDHLSDFRQSTLIGVRLGEEAYGTSAGDAEVMFTLRAFTNESMSALRQMADKEVVSIAEKNGLQLSVSESDPFNATENTRELVERLGSHFTAAGCAVRNLAEPFRWSEDFANYLLHWPGALFGVGSGVDHAELHHPLYDFPDGIIGQAANYFHEIVKNKIY